jgi:hypothetical protein
MIAAIRTKIGRYYLRRELLKHERKSVMTNLPNARRIGILYTVEDVPDYERISQLVAELQGEQKEVKALGFVRNKNLLQRFLPKLSFDFFTRHDLNWFFIPVPAQVKDFIEKEFDLLLDLSMQDTFPLKYIAGLSNALCRVGRYSESDLNCYDLMFDIKPDATLDDYMLNIRHYLTIINTDAKRNR